MFHIFARINSKRMCVYSLKPINEWRWHSASNKYNMNLYLRAHFSNIYEKKIRIYFALDLPFAASLIVVLNYSYTFVWLKKKRTEQYTASMRQVFNSSLVARWLFCFLYRQHLQNMEFLCYKTASFYSRLEWFHHHRMLNSELFILRH